MYVCAVVLVMCTCIYCVLCIVCTVLFCVVCLCIKYTNTCRKSSQKHNYICNIQGVIVYTNLSQLHVSTSSS